MNLSPHWMNEDWHTRAERKQTEPLSAMDERGLARLHSSHLAMRSNVDISQRDYGPLSAMDERGLVCATRNEELVNRCSPRNGASMRSLQLEIHAHLAMRFSYAHLATSFAGRDFGSMSIQCRNVCTLRYESITLRNNSDAVLVPGPVNKVANCANRMACIMQAKAAAVN
jgi:hypothetical protein